MRVVVSATGKGNRHITVDVGSSASSSPAATSVGSTSVHSSNTRTATKRSSTSLAATPSGGARPSADPLYGLALAHSSSDDDDDYTPAVTSRLPPDSAAEQLFMALLVEAVWYWGGDHVDKTKSIGQLTGTASDNYSTASAIYKFAKKLERDGKRIFSDAGLAPGAPTRRMPEDCYRQLTIKRWPEYAMLPKSDFKPELINDAIRSKEVVDAILKVITAQYSCRKRS